MDIKAAIEAIRAEKRISKADMAKTLDMDPSNYHRLESRGDKLTLEQLKQIADSLEVTLSDLIFWGEERPINDDVDIRALHSQITNLQSQLSDKSQLQQYHNKQLQRVNLWFANYFRHEVWQVAVKLGMVNSDTNYLIIANQYANWTLEEKRTIVESGLASNPFIYQMINRDLYIDNQEFAELILEHGTPESVADYQRRKKAGK